MRNSARASAPLFLVAAFLLTAPRAAAAGPTVSECLGANEQSIGLRRESKLQAARSQLLVCAAASCPAEIRKECTERLDRVNAAIPTVVFEIRDASGNDVVSVQVSVDGQPLTDRKEGVALPLDPGTHSFIFEANGFVRMEKSFVLRQGEKDRRELITLSNETANQATSPLVPGIAPAPTAPADEQRRVPSPSSTGATENAVTARAERLRTAAFVVGGVGVVSIGVGAVFGIVAKRSYDASNDDNHCRASGCDEKGLSYRNDAFKQARVSTVFFIGGAALTAGGLGLYLISRSQRERPAASQLAVVPLVAQSGAGVALAGGF